MITTPVASDRSAEYDFIIVGSGAGGGPLACNLARKKFRVLLIEAGTHSEPAKDPPDKNQPTEHPPANDRPPKTWDIPAFHTQATEDPEISWEYFVRHYDDLAQSRRDSKWVEDRKGIFYPRATGIGGCTVHNAMVTLSGPADDWDAIASLVDDRSWNSERMRGYFERLENCHYARPGYVGRRGLGWVYDLLAKIRGNRGRHGFSGWLDTSWPDALLLVKRREWQLLRSILAAFLAARSAQMTGVWPLIWATLTGKLAAELDPNHWERLRKRPEGLALVPMAVKDGRRRSVRDYVLETERAFPEYLTIWTDTLVTSVMFRDGTTEACGVNYLYGKALYKANPRRKADKAEKADKTNKTDDGMPGQVSAKCEVILAAGAFNTPQLLMLSGIGPCEELKEHGIPVRVSRPGVGMNLQDRYEVAVIWKMPKELSLLSGLKFDLETHDPALQEWRKTHSGVYASNGVLLSLLKKSRPDVSMPDLCIFAVPGNFKGYFPGYSCTVTKDPRYLTWLILKAHTKDRRGTVRLASRDPQAPPVIDFSYFREGSDIEGDDIQGLVEGIKFVRQMTRWRPRGVKEFLPGNDVKTDAELSEFVAKEAWGHHASCSCPIGPAQDPRAVLDGDFRVHGTTRLRVVDASAFPQIPGMFIVANIYMLAERATDVISNAYRR